MRWTLMHKYVGSLFGALITCCGVVLFVSIYFMKTPIENELDKGIQRMCQVVRMSNESTAQRFAQSAALMADEDSLARAIAEKDHETAYRLGQTAMKKAKSDFMTITDAEGWWWPAAMPPNTATACSNRKPWLKPLRVSRPWP